MKFAWNWLAFALGFLVLLAGCAYRPAKPAEVAVVKPDQKTNAPASDSRKILAAPAGGSNLVGLSGVLRSNLPSIFIAGDSTAAQGVGEFQQGWGVLLADYFDPAKARVNNRARGGRSSRTFVTEGHWDQLLAEVKPGDMVLVQFGHNDSGAPFAVPFRGSLPGFGPETQEGIGREGKLETIHTFGWYLRKMVAETRAVGATPILISPTVRNVWKDHRVERGPGRFGSWAEVVAREEHVLCLNLADKMADQFELLGEGQVKDWYPKDHTHFNAEGADRHAAAVVSLLKGLRPSPVRSFLSQRGAGVEADKFSWLQLPRPANPGLPSIFLIGDSTVRNGRGDGANQQWGWGDLLGAQFKEEKINVVNRAVGGMSSRTYLTQGHWETVQSLLRPGDYVLIQFGHNDNGSATNPPPGRSSLPGVGEESVEVVDPVSHRSETVHTFGWYLRRYVAEARAKGATPIICSLVPRKIWKAGRIVRNRDAHAGWAAAVAQSAHVPFIDLNEIIARHYEELGPDRVNPLFGDEHTHTTAAGAELNAQCVVEGLNALPNNPMAPYLLPHPVQ